MEDEKPEIRIFPKVRKKPDHKNGGLKNVGRTVLAAVLAGTIANVDNPSQAPSELSLPRTEQRGQRLTSQLELVFSDQELQGLAQEIRSWSLINGTKVVQLFPEAERAATVLAGEVDTRLFIPFVDSRLRFADNKNEDASLDIYRLEDDATKRVAQIILPPGGQFPEGANIDYKWFNNTKSTATIKLSPAIQRTSVRLPVAIKEASQAYDYREYARLYLKLAEEKGVSFRVFNPDAIPMDEEEKITNVAEVMGYTERAITGQTRSFFDILVDSGSHIRLGGIIFANWYQDQLSRGITPVETNTVRLGKNWVGFLERKGIIKKQDNLWIWSKGSAPAINSPEFLELIKELSGRPGPRFH